MLRSLLFSFCLLILLVVSGNNSVQAQTDTPEPPTPTNTPIQTNTPTPTFVPLFNPDDQPVIDYNCTGNQPIGWGTVTPSAWWYMNCARCVTPIAQPTTDWGENPFEGTLQPGQSTPTPTPPTGGNNKISDVCFSGAGVCFDKEVEKTFTYRIEYKVHPYYQFYVPSTEWDTPTNQTYYTVLDSTVDFIGKGSSYNGYYVHLYLEAECWVDQCTITLEDQSIITLGFSQKVNIWKSDPLSVAAGGTIEMPETKLKLNIVNNIHGYTEKGIWITHRVANGSGTSASIKGDITTNILWSDDPFTYGNFCGQVQDGGETGVGGDEDIFSLPIIATGQGTCLQFYSITIPLSWLTAVWQEAQDIMLPSWSICFKPITFGELILFGYSYNMDLIALAMAGVVLIRMIFTS